MKEVTEALLAISGTVEIMLNDSDLLSKTQKAASLLTSALLDGQTVLVAGNGGSAGEAQHFAAEIVGRYKKERKGYPAIALTTDTSAITAIANDYQYDFVFERQLQALGKAGDVFIALSTSGNSENLIRALSYAKSAGISTISLSGKGGGRALGLADIDIVVPSELTPTIQELQLTVLHALCAYIDDQLT